ncbi:dehydrodolichyl diphosphate synthase 6-like protein, partial [Tanacetum coccineum]
MDGNRRYSKQHNLIDRAGHRVGFSSLMSMLRYCYELGSRKFERRYLIGGLLGRLGIMDSETLAVPEKGYTSSHNTDMCEGCNVRYILESPARVRDTIKRSKNMYLMIYLENLEHEYKNQKSMLETEVTKYFNKGMEVEAQEMRTKVAVVMRVDNRVKRMKLPRTPPISQ